MGARGGGPHACGLPGRDAGARDGSRLGVVYGNKAYVLDVSGRRVGRALRQSGAVLVAQIRPDGRQLATIEQVAELLHPPPPSPAVRVLTPFLFLAGAGGPMRTTVARSTPTTGWLGDRLMRAERSRTSPFAQGICLLASNTGFECERLVAAEADRDLWGPAASPNGRLIAATRAPVKGFTGGIAI